MLIRKYNPENVTTKELKALIRNNVSEEGPDVEVEERGDGGKSSVVPIWK